MRNKTMLSDEEKKAIEDLKRHIIPFKLNDTLLDLIEKQQQEIEKLNKSDTSKEQSSMYYYNLYEKLVDKIKAKIEELNKQEQDLQNSISDKEREEYSDANISWELMDIQIRREVLQSLLEKE